MDGCAARRSRRALKPEEMGPPRGGHREITKTTLAVSERATSRGNSAYRNSGWLALTTQVAEDQKRAVNRGLPPLTIPEAARAKDLAQLARNHAPGLLRPKSIGCIRPPALVGTPIHVWLPQSPRTAPRSTTATPPRSKSPSTARPDPENWEQEEDSPRTPGASSLALAPSPTSVGPATTPLAAADAEILLPQQAPPPPLVTGFRHHFLGSRAMVMRWPTSSWDEAKGDPRPTKRSRPPPPSATSTLTVDSSSDDKRRKRLEEPLGKLPRPLDLIAQSRADCAAVWEIVNIAPSGQGTSSSAKNRVEESGATSATSSGNACRFRQMSGAPSANNSSLEAILGRIDAAHPPRHLRPLDPRPPPPNHRALANGLCPLRHVHLSERTLRVFLERLLRLVHRSPRPSKAKLRGRREPGDHPRPPRL